MSVTTMIIIAMLVVVLIQRSRESMYAAAVFAQMAFFHDAFFGNLESWWYYISAVAADLLVIILLLPVSGRNKLAYRLSMLSGMSMGLNALGILVWYYVELAEVYRWAFITLYAYAIHMMLSRYGGEDGRYGVDRVRNGARTSNTSRCDIASICATSEARN